MSDRVARTWASIWSRCAWTYAPRVCQILITRPETNRNVRARVQSINERILGDLSGWEAFIVAGIAILVAAANVANLMLARSMHRAPEIAIRTSLGASRVRIVRQLLVEAAIIAAAGAVFGALFSKAGVVLMQSAIPEGTLTAEAYTR